MVAIAAISCSEPSTRGRCVGDRDCNYGEMCHTVSEHCVTADGDGDGVCDPVYANFQAGCTGSDNCQYIPNPDQADTNGDGTGDMCQIDDDGDGVCDDAIGVEGICAMGPDNCRLIQNTDQLDDDHNGIGSACQEEE